METMTIPLGGGAATCGTAASGRSLCDPVLFSLKWGDVAYQRDYAQKMHYVLMPQDQWERGAKEYLAANPHNWTARKWVAKVKIERSEHKNWTSQRVVVEMPDSDEMTLRVWKDMIEEPWKYGDDITEWLALDEEVMSGPKRWRAGAFWVRKEEEARRLAEEEARKQNASATRIQALWRGYATRCRLQEESEIEELARIIREGLKEEPWKYDGDSVMVFLELDKGTWPSDASDSE